jgi:integrase/recombinase XerD
LVSGLLSPSQFEQFGGKRQAQKIEKCIANRARISKPVTPHVLRHTFACAAAQRGISIAALQKIFGHDRLETTAIYLNMNPEDVLEHFHEKW